MEYANLLSVKAQVDKCVRCAACQAGCPTYESSLAETLSARGRIRLARALLEGDLKPSARVAADFDMCLSCMACMDACPAKIDTVAIFQAARADLAPIRGMGFVKRMILHHVLPYPVRLNALAKLTGMAALVYENAPEFLVRFLPYTFQGRRRNLPNLLQTNLRALAPTGGRGHGWDGSLHRVAYFSGCMTDLAYPDAGLSVMRELERAGVEVIYPQEQVCCGAPAWFAGDNDTARSLVRRNIQVLGALDVEAVVVSCATCGSTLSHLLPTLADDPPAARKLAAKVIDFQKLMVELGMETVYKGMSGGRKLKVTYHDPCHLKRGMGVSAEPRALIKSLPNVEFVEMEGADVCCGGAGAFTLDHGDESARFGAVKAAALAKSGADIAVTECPSCQLQLTGALARAGVSMPVMSSAGLVDMVMKEAHTTKE
jgi:glycolate oxidase iron-sulfur subunit